jgi:hypothetical protein
MELSSVARLQTPSKCPPGHEQTSRQVASCPLCPPKWTFISLIIREASVSHDSTHVLSH